MYNLTAAHIVGITITLIGITIIGIYSGKNIKSSSDFSGGARRAGAPIIAGTIMGTLVGGSSTVGTAQLAFLYGFSAWWFTLGAGIGLLIMALFFVKPLYNTKNETVSEILMSEFGNAAGLFSSIFVSIGMFLNIIGQVLAAIALLMSIFKIAPLIAAVISIILMASYVCFGGVWGTGIVGIAKLFLLYIAVMYGGYLALSYGGGISSYINTFPLYPYFSLFGRGFWIDFAAGFSLVIGVLTTQTYVQAVLSGKSLRESVKGSLISAFFIPPIGLAGIFIGLYMKMNYPDLNPASAFPEFVIRHMNPLFGGIVLATLLITVVGTAAGLSLGISTLLAKDIYKNYIDKHAEDDKFLKVSRIMILFVLALTLFFISGNIKSLIQKWSYMSMGLRGATAFGPLCAALFLKGKVNKNLAIGAMFFGPLSMLLVKPFLPENFDPLYVGVAVNFLLVMIGWILGNDKKSIAHE
jgi:SSS family solute:Na+ symporter